MATQYVLQDRTLATKWALKITDAQLLFESTADAAQDEPIFEDDINSGTYWKLFIDDEQIGIESTVTVQDDDVTLADTSNGSLYRLIVNDGQFGFESVPTPSKEVYRVVKSDIPIKSVNVAGSKVTIGLSYSNRISKWTNTPRVIISVGSGGGGLDTTRFRYNVNPVEAEDGIVTVFTLPSSEAFVSGLIEVFVNGNRKVKDVEWQETGTTQITFLGDLSTTPPASHETVTFNYIVSV